MIHSAEVAADKFSNHCLKSALFAQTGKLEQLVFGIPGFEIDTDSNCFEPGESFGKILRPLGQASSLCFDNSQAEHSNFDFS